MARNGTNPGMQRALSLESQSGDSEAPIKYYRQSLEECSEHANLSVETPPAVLADFNVIFLAMRWNPDAFLEALTEAWTDEQWIQLLQRYPSCLENAPDSVKGDTNIIQKVVEMHPGLLRYINLPNDAILRRKRERTATVTWADVILTALRRDKSVVRFIQPDVLSRDESLDLAHRQWAFLLGKVGGLLESSPDWVRRNNDLVLIAVKKWCGALIYALVQDADIALAAVLQDPLAIEDVWEWLRTWKLRLLAISSGSEELFLEYTTPEERADPIKMRQLAYGEYADYRAVIQMPMPLRMQFLKDPAFIIDCVIPATCEFPGFIKDSIPECHHDDPRVAAAILKANPFAYQDLRTPLQADTRLAMQAAGATNGVTIQYYPVLWYLHTVYFAFLPPLGTSMINLRKQAQKHWSPAVLYPHCKLPELKLYDIDFVLKLVPLQVMVCRKVYRVLIQVFLGCSGRAMLQNDVPLPLGSSRTFLTLMELIERILGVELVALA